MAVLSGIYKFTRRHEIKSVAIYTFSNFLSKGISFLLLFYFTSVLTETDFGMLNLFSNSMLFLMPLISMGVLHSVSAEYFKKDKNEFSSFFSTTLIIPAVVTLLLMAALFIFRAPLQLRYGFPPELIVLIPLITFFSFLNEHFINMIRNNNEPSKYLLVNTGRLFVEITLAVFLISTLGYGWTGRAMGITIAYFIVAVYAISYFREKKYLPGSIQKKYLGEEIKYSVPVILMQTGIFFMSSSAGYFVEHFTHNYATVGVYSVALTLSSVISVLCAALMQYMYPKIYSLLSEKEIRQDELAKLFILYAGIMLAGTVAIMIIIPLVYVYGLKPSYAQGLSYYSFICIGFLLWSVSCFFYPFMLYYKQKKKLVLVSVSSIIVCIISHAFFTGVAGAFGAAASVCIVYLFNLCITAALLRRQLQPFFKAFTEKLKESNWF